MLLRSVLLRSCVFYFIIVLFFSSCEKNNFNIDRGFNRFYFKDSLLFVAYSTLNHQYPINSLSHFRAAAEYGFNSLKADLRITKDSVLILCHDSGYTFDKDGRITRFDSENCIQISDMLSSVILDLEVSFYSKSMGYYEHPMLFEDYLVLCDSLNVIPYVTVRGDHLSSTLNTLYGVLRSYDKEDSVIINVFPPSIKTCSFIREYGNTPVCLTLFQGDSITQELISDVEPLGNISICVHFSCLDSITPEIKRMLDEKGIGLYTWYVSNEEECKNAISVGCEGFQVTDINVVKDYLSSF